MIRQPLGLPIAALVCLLLWPSGADAGGPEFTDNGARVVGRGGAFVAKADDPIAMHYNPAGLTRWKGHKLLAGAQLSSLYGRYTRSGIDPFVANGTYTSATSKDTAGPFIAPTLAWAYGGDGWGVGFGVYGPGSNGKREFPAQGANRFMLNSAEILVGFVTASVAVDVTDWLTAGLSLQWVVVPQNDFSLVIDGNPDPNSPSIEDSIALTEAKVETTAWNGVAVILGFHIRPMKELEIGLASRITPISLSASGKQTLTAVDPGSKPLLDLIKFVDASGNEDNGVRFDFTLAPWVRTGIRYVDRDAEGGENWDLELDFVAEFWSVYEDYVLSFDGNVKFAAGTPRPVEAVVLPREYKDTFALKLGSDIRLAEPLTLRLGAYVETAASPEAYTNLDFFPFFRVGMAIGASVHIGPIEISAAYQFVWQPERTVAVGESEVYMTRPLNDAPEPAGWNTATQGEYQGLEVGSGSFMVAYHTAALSILASF